MKKFSEKIIYSLPLVSILLLAAFLFLFPDISYEGVNQGLRVCVNSILPMLFPFFVITNIWCNLEYSEKTGRALSAMMQKIFHLPGNTASTFLLGLIGGYPTGAQSVVKQYEQGKITKHDAEHLLLFSNNAGPAFVLGVAGSALFQSVQLGIVLYIIHIVSAVIVGILFRPAKSTDSVQSNIRHRNTSFSSVLTSSIRQGGQTALQVCVFVVFFSVLTGYLKEFLPHTQNTDLFVKLMLGSVELASGAWMLQDIPNKAISFCIMAFLLGWGGLCVAFQTISILDETDLTAGQYLLCKLLHGFISFLLAAVLVPLLPAFKHQSVFKIQLAKPAVVLVLLSIGLIPLLVLLKKTSGNKGRNQL